MDQPKRRLVLKLELGADSMQELHQALSGIAFDLSQESDRAYHSVSGSPSAGYVLDIEFNPEQTHESYHMQVQGYLAEKKADLTGNLGDTSQSR